MILFIDSVFSYDLWWVTSFNIYYNFSLSCICWNNIHSYVSVPRQSQGVLFNKQRVFYPLNILIINSYDNFLSLYSDTFTYCNIGINAAKVFNRCLIYVIYILSILKHSYICQQNGIKAQEIVIWFYYSY